MESYARVLLLGHLQGKRRVGEKDQLSFFIGS